MAPHGSSGSGYLPLTNRDPKLKTKSHTPQFLNNFYLFLPGVFTTLRLFCKVEETAPERLFSLIEDETI